MSAVLKLHTATRLVLSALLEDPAREVYGRQLMRSTGLESGTLYVILARLRKHGWLTCRWGGARPPHGGPSAAPIRQADRGRCEAGP